MIEPMHKHEMLDALWEYEQPFMRMEELLDWAERGFRDYLDEMTESELKARYNRLQQLSEHFSEEIYDDAM